MARARSNGQAPTAGGIPAVTDEEKESLSAEIVATVVRMLQGGGSASDKAKEIVNVVRESTDLHKDVGIHEEIEAFPLDAAVAFSRALRERYGWVSPVPTPGFFGDSPPTSVEVQTNVGEFTQVFWGSFTVPDIIGRLQTQANWEAMKFYITGVVRASSIPEVKQIAALTRKYLAEASIYRGKAFKLVLDDDGDFDRSKAPTYIDVLSTKEEEMIFSADLMRLIETNIFVPMEHTARCRELSIPLKRGILLEGPYGTGKSLTASIAAKKAVQNGWTFMTVERVTAIRDALRFAQMYQPCLLFVEDIDREMAGERSAEMDDILNTIDGVVAKKAEIMVVLTSNNADAIHPAMLRPGRLDAVLRIDPPDSDAAERLMRLFGRGLIRQKDHLTESKAELAGQIPATIREAVERSKLSAIARTPVGTIHITDEDIALAARGMMRHLELLNRKVTGTPSHEQAAGEALGRLVNHTLVNGHTDGFSPAFETVRGEVSSLTAMMDSMVDMVRDMSRKIDAR